MSDPFFLCPHCGARVGFERKNCPQCGSDDETGWSPMTLYDDLDLPGHESEQNVLLSLRDTLLWRDLKWVVSLILFLAVLALGLRW
jgi:hypothetical protein